MDIAAVMEHGVISRNIIPTISLTPQTENVVRKPWQMIFPPLARPAI